MHTQFMMPLLIHLYLEFVGCKLVQLRWDLDSNFTIYSQFKYLCVSNLEHLCFP